MSPNPPVHPVPSIFNPASTPAAAIHDLSWLVLAICGGIFLIVAGVIVYCIVRFRQRPGDDREPPQIYGSLQIELAWTIIPVLIVVVLFLVTMRYINELELTRPPEGALAVKIIGRQWWWEIHYPGLGIVTANELHLPAGTEEAPRPAFLTLESADVIHSFWVPALAGKTDVVPNRTNTMWVAPWKTGTFLGQCAEYCGTQHAHMLLRVIVQPPAEFQAWVDEQRRPSVVDASADAGRSLFESTACVSCHTLRGTVARGSFGPDLTHLMSRETIGAGAALNNPANLHAWIVDPDHFKPGVLMPAMKLSLSEIEQLTAYLLTLR